MSFDVFVGYDRRCNQAAEVSCPQCGVVWHFNTVKDARGFGQTHANECGSADMSGSVSAHFDCAYDDTPAPEAWGAPDVIAMDVHEWLAMADMTTHPQWKVARLRMAERARISLDTAAKQFEERHPELKVCRESGRVSPR